MKTAAIFLLLSAFGLGPCSQALRTGQTVVGTIPVGDLDVFTFAVSGEDTITVLLREGIPSDLALKVLTARTIWRASVARGARFSGNHDTIVQNYRVSVDGNCRITG